jgi:glycosyltransferase involved in cell wall biosynthesis
MRVLHLSSGNMFGGVETLLATLARYASVSSSLEPHFGFAFRGRIEREIREVGLPVHLFNEIRLRDPLIRREEIECVICHGYWPIVIFGLEVRRAEIPLVMWLHDLPDGKHWLQRLARRIVPDLVLCNSRFTAGLVSRLYPATRHEVLYYPVELAHERGDRQERAATRGEADTGVDDVVIVQVSRMEEWKGHALHLRALAEIRDVPNWVCWQVGGAQRPSEEAYRAHLERLAVDLGIAERVRFLGQRSDVLRLLDAADVHCQPNTGPEPFGITFVEALNAGLPVVTTAMGGAQEIVDSSCGILVPPADAVALGEALRRMIGDDQLRARLGAAGPRRAAELCAPERQIPRLSEILHTLSPQRTTG